MSYLYKTGNNPPTTELWSLMDACEDSIRRGDKTMCLIKRAVKRTNDVIFWHDYMVIEGVPNRRGKIDIKSRTVGDFA